MGWDGMDYISKYCNVLIFHDVFGPHFRTNMAKLNKKRSVGSEQ